MTPTVNPRKIAIALDTCDGSKTAFEVALKSSTPEDTLLLLHVRPVKPQIPDNFSDESERMRYQEDAEKQAQEAQEASQKVLSTYKDLAAQEKRQCEALELHGDAREVLVEACRVHSVDLLVIGSTGKSMLKQAMLGSTSDYVAHHVDCPVLIARKSHHVGEAGDHVVVSPGGTISEETLETAP